MNSLMLNTVPQATSVVCTDDELRVLLDDGRSITVPIVWFPRLKQASTVAQQHYELMGHGQGIYWPDIDEDISVLGLLAGRASVEYSKA